MKGFLQEYGIIMVVVAVVLGMLAFGKTGYAKSIQNAILGSADHIVETGENIVPKPAKASDVIEIEGVKYIVLEEYENNQALVMKACSVKDENKDFQSHARIDYKNTSTYEGSDIDKYLENEWYNSLSSTMKAAIQPTNIKQVSYTIGNDPDLKQETGHNGQVYNTISRHVFLPSVSEIGNVVDLKNPDKVKAFLNGSYNMWTRDSHHGYDNTVEILNTYTGYLFYTKAYTANAVWPAFVIDLSQIDYKTVGHTDYK